MERFTHLCENYDIDLEQKDERGWNALHWGIFNVNEAVAIYLIEQKKVDLDQKADSIYDIECMLDDLFTIKSKKSSIKNIRKTIGLERKNKITTSHT